MKGQAIVYCENELGEIAGMAPNDLVRYSEKYTIVGIIDSTKAGFDAGEHLDGIKKGIPIFKSIDDAIESLHYIPEYFIYGISLLSSIFEKEEKEILFAAMEKSMSICLPEFFVDDKELVIKAIEYGVSVCYVGQSPQKK